MTPAPVAAPARSKTPALLVALFALLASLAAATAVVLALRALEPEPVAPSTTPATPAPIEVPKPPLREAEKPPALSPVASAPDASIAPRPVTHAERRPTRPPDAAIPSPAPIVAAPAGESPAFRVTFQSNPTLPDAMQIRAFGRHLAAEVEMCRGGAEQSARVFVNATTGNPVEVTFSTSSGYLDSCIRPAASRVVNTLPRGSYALHGELTVPAR